MARIYALLAVLDVILLVYAVIDCITTPRDEVRNLPKIFWILLIILFSPIGWIAWFIAGRPRKDGPARPASPQPPSRPLAPDDDPDFLRGLSQRKNSDDEKLLKDWEADLRRREEELRKRDENGDDKKDKPGEG
ncbi:PLD nuclease N-terminal domain-containing protein [Longispora albida]|uniref:PLD nuclease N-terminal domain-containing protein n=1 Tax=Longispora albida TaxID=203523 RepID=UPI00037A9963|nr:PLD nuclease N-terminal domain-containing protein [Longispora albida]